MIDKEGGKPGSAKEHKEKSRITVKRTKTLAKGAKRPSAAEAEEEKISMQHPKTVALVTGCETLLPTTLTKIHRRGPDAHRHGGPAGALFTLTAAGFRGELNPVLALRWRKWWWRRWWWGVVDSGWAPAGRRFLNVRHAPRATWQGPGRGVRQGNKTWCSHLERRGCAEPTP